MLQGGLAGPRRSALKQGGGERDRAGSVASGASSSSGRKSVRYAVGAEQTTV